MAQYFVLDKAAILARLGGDREIFSMMAVTYLEDAADYCVRLAAALAAGDAEALRCEAHAVKGLLGTLADESGAALALTVETRARGGECAGLAAQVGDLQARLRLVAAAVRAEVSG